MSGPAACSGSLCLWISGVRTCPTCSCDFGGSICGWALASLPTPCLGPRVWRSGLPWPVGSARLIGAGGPQMLLGWDAEASFWHPEEVVKSGGPVVLHSLFMPSCLYPPRCSLTGWAATVRQAPELALEKGRLGQGLCPREAPSPVTRLLRWAGRHHRAPVCTPHA